MKPKQIIIYSTLTILAVVVIVALLNIDYITNNLLDVQTSSNKSVSKRLSYEAVPSTQKILTDVKNDGAYLPLTKTDMWDGELQDQVLQTPGHGKLYINRATITKPLESNFFDVKFENGEEYRVTTDENVYLSAPMYVYETDSDKIVSYRRKELDRSVLNYLKKGNVIILKYYEGNLNNNEKTILAREILLADIKLP
ncbi:MAG: hypothetical protein U0525_05760 [Patescibacteria group bacterium]